MVVGQRGVSAQQIRPSRDADLRKLADGRQVIMAQKGKTCRAENRGESRG
jgi:hypothetical protein